MSKTLDHLIKHPANIFIPSILFVLLSPGFLINVKLELPLINNIPYIKEIPNYILHTFLFAIIYTMIIISFPKYYF